MWNLREAKLSNKAKQNKRGGYQREEWLGGGRNGEVVQLYTHR